MLRCGGTAEHLSIFTLDTHMTAASWSALSAVGFDEQLYVEGEGESESGRSTFSSTSVWSDAGQADPPSSSSGNATAPSSSSSSSSMAGRFRWPNTNSRAKAGPGPGRVAGIVAGNHQDFYYTVTLFTIYLLSSCAAVGCLPVSEGLNKWRRDHNK